MGTTGSRIAGSATAIAGVSTAASGSARLMPSQYGHRLYMSVSIMMYRAAIRTTVATGLNDGTGAIGPSRASNRASNRGKKGARPRA